MQYPCQNIPPTGTDGPAPPTCTCCTCTLQEVQPASGMYIVQPATGTDGPYPPPCTHCTCCTCTLQEVQPAAGMLNQTLIQTVQEYRVLYNLNPLLE